METGLASLVHDAAVLYRFADFIEAYCKEQERSQRYIDASGDFFRYAKEVAGGIKRKLRDYVERAGRFPPAIAASRIATLRRNILTFKDCLRVLHTHIKPAADAHTLSIPAPLVNLACDQLQMIEGMENSRIVVLLTPQLMYFQRPHTHVKRQAARVEKELPEAQFPPKLGFIELPYSQGSSLFTNLAIYHEIGHFVYEELSALSPPNPYLTELELVTNRSLMKFARLKKDPQVRLLAEKIIESWTQEIFCDLLALHLVGPGFSFALVEILAMLGRLSPEATVTFNQEHPAPAFRFAEHVRFLSEDSTWWDAISHVEAEQKKVIQSMARVPAKHYTVYTDEKVPKVLITTFVKSIVPAIRELVRQLAPGTASAAKRFVDTRVAIEDCLSVGVVPHSNSSTHPDPVSIINSAFCFYLTSLPNVVKEFEGPEAEADIEKQSKWTKKLEDWTLKAIEDYQIRAQFERMQPDGSA